MPCITFTLRGQDEPSPQAMLAETRHEGGITFYNGATIASVRPPASVRRLALGTTPGSWYGVTGTRPYLAPAIQ